MNELFQAMDWGLLAWECMGAAIGVYFSSLSYHVTPKLSFFNLFAGGGSWLIYSLLSVKWKYFGSVFLASVFVSLWAQYGARKFKVPASTILIPSLYTLVPGIPMYQGLNAFLSNQLFEAAAFVSKALIMAFAVAVGVGLVQSLVNSFKKAKSRVSGMKKAKKKS